jgi:hypothetical protein
MIMSYERTRDKTADAVFGEFKQTYVPSGTVYYPNTEQTQGSFFTITDVVTPGFRKKSAAGEIIVSPCTMYGESVSAECGVSFELINKNGNIPWWRFDGSGSMTQWCAYRTGFDMTPNYLSLLDDDAMLDASRQSSLARVDSAPYGFAEDFAEIKETIQFLKQPLKSIRNLALKMRKATRKKAFKLGISEAEALASVWLEYRFAFSPLVRSIVDAIEASQQSFDAVLQPYYTARDKAVASDSSSATIPRSLGGQSLNFKVTSSDEITVSTGVYYETTNPINTLLEGLGLRVADIPETIWAVFPLSFMVDRMYNISSMISGLRALSDPQLKLLKGWSSVKRTRTVDFQLEKFPVSPNPAWLPYVAPPGDHVRYEYFSYGRSLWIPSWLDTLPVFNIKGLVSDITNIIDLIALITNILLVRK